MITKRLLGLLFVVGGALAIIALFVWDMIGASDYSGIGPVARLIMQAAGLVIVIGLTLIPLGNRPA